MIEKDFYFITMDAPIIELLYYRRMKILIDYRIPSSSIVIVHLRYR